MITRAQFKEAQIIGAQLLGTTGISLRDDELEKISIADFGLGNLDTFGAQILTLTSTDQIAVKLIAMYSGQILPEHWHPIINEYEGKEEILRVEYGDMYLYTPGDPTQNPLATIPNNKIDCFKNWHETIMKPGDMYTLKPTTPHWFQAGPQGMVVWSFSTKVLDLQDEFTDKEIIRETIIKEDG